MFLLKFWNFLKTKFKKNEPILEELPDNIIDFNDFVHYRLKFNSEKKIYQKVLEYSEDDLN